MISMRSPIAKVRGLGAAHEGVEHWWLQRVTAVGNLLLIVWFAVSVVTMTGASHAELRDWLSAPVPAVLTVLMLVSLFYHMALGLQVVIEDYVAKHAVRLAVLVGVKFLCMFLAGVGILSVLRIALG